MVKLGVVSEENNQAKKVFLMGCMVVVGSDKTQAAKNM